MASSQPLFGITLTLARKRCRERALPTTLKKRNVLTFGTVRKKKVTKAAGREITMKAGNKLFA